MWSAFFHKINFYRYIFILFCSALFSWCFYWITIGAYYSYPNAEDLSLSNIAQQEYGFVRSIVETMISYDGRYFTNALHAFNPLVFGWIEGYKFMPIFSILFLTLTFYFFINSLSLKIVKSHLFLYSIAYVTITVILAPSIAYYLYWMVSSFVYLLPWGFFFLWTGGLIRFYKAKHNISKNFWFVMCSVFLFFCVGMNEMFLSLNLIALCTAFIYFHKKDFTKEYLPIFFIGIASIALFLSAPGIHHRMDGFEVNRNLNYLIEIAHSSITHFTQSIISWLFFTPLIIVTGFISTLHLPKELIKKLKVVPIKKGAAISFLSLFTLYLMTLSYYYPMGHYPNYPKKIFNFILPGFTLIILLVIPYLISKTEISKFFKRKPALKIISTSILIGVTLIHVLFSENNISEIRREYRQGVFKNYKKQMVKRYSKIEKAREKPPYHRMAIFDTLVNPPTTIYHPPDILPNRKAFYWNKAYEDYFKIDEVRLKNDTTSQYFIRKFYKFYRDN